MAQRPVFVSMVAIAIATVAVLLIARATGADAIGRAFEHIEPPWIALVAGAELVTYPAYILAYRSIARLDGHAAIALPLVARIVVAGFGPFALSGGFGIDKQALHALHEDEDSARRRVVALGTIEWVILAPVASVVAIILLVQGANILPSLLWPWALAVPAGFAVGAVERDQVLDGRTAVEGDVVLGLASSGLHSNGFSLVRRVVEVSRLDYAARAPFADPSRGDVSLGAALLAPTRLYVKSCLAAHRAGLLKGLAHITGGGFTENIPRVLPEGLGVAIDATAWQLPPVFRWLEQAGNIAPAELGRTFNCGIGMVAIVDAKNIDQAERVFREHGETVHRIGRVVRAGEQRVTISGLDTWRD